MTTTTRRSRAAYADDADDDADDAAYAAYATLEASVDGHVYSATDYDRLIES